MRSISHSPGIVTWLLLGCGLTGCAQEPSPSEATEIQSTRHALSVPDEALAKTLAPLRRLETPGAVYLKNLRETFPGSGVLPQTIHFYQPDGNGEAISLELTATTSTGAIDGSHAFQTVVLTSHPGEADETTLPPFANGAGQKTYTVSTSTAGWYRLSFQYVAPNANRTLGFRAFDALGNALKIGWSDPSGANVQVRATVRVDQSSQAFFKGGAYRNASASEFATVDNVKVDNNLLYRRGFDQGPFNYPLGWLSAADHTLEFSFTASGIDPSYQWFGVNEQSFDGTGAKNEWAPVQFLYRGAMHTATYDAWKEGVAFAQGATLVPGVRPAPVRRGTAFGVAVEDTSLNGTWANASLRVYPLGSANQMPWTATQSTAGDYVGGIWTAGGFSSRNRETWTVQIPSDAPVGRYVLRAISPWGYQIGPDVLFYVIHNPYPILASGGITKQELETFGYDEDEDGVSLAGNVGSDVDNARDHFLALYDSEGFGSNLYFARSFLTGAFRRTQADTSFSMLDMVMAASHGTTSEFDSMRRLYRLVAQRLTYSHFSLYDDTSVTFMADGSTFDPTAAAIVSQSGTINTDTTGGQCHDYGSILTALARAGGIVSRVISSTAGLGGWGLHYFAEAYIPDLPHQGGKTGPTGGADSDSDHWYVFDATDPLGGGTELFWVYHSEAIAPRATYGMASKITSAPSLDDSIVATTRLDWDPMFSGTVTPADLLSVADAYFSPGREYWLTNTPATGFIGFSDKDVYRVSKEATGATGVRVSMLSTADQTLVPALCVVSASAPAPQLPTRCATPGQTVDLPDGESYVVVFNTTPNEVVTLPDGGWAYSRILRGDVTAYALEVVQSGSSCTDANSVDMGAPGTSVTVANNGCLKVTQYPSWWGTRKLQLQNMSPGRYPTPFTVSNCNANKGSGTITADWQSFYINGISASCTTYVKLGGDGQGTVMVRYYAM